jgi:kanamycin nucleotidyltransferase
VERWQTVDRIVADLHRTHGEGVLAIALYGSLARATDGPYSDIEIWCMVDEPGLDTTEEWVYGPNKAEVDLYGADVMAASAVEVDEMWSLRQGEIMNCRPLFGDRARFEALRAAVMSPPKETFDEVVAEMVVGECFEWMGKIRNGVAHNDLDFLPITACNFTLHLALMAALLHRHIYSTSSALMREALALPSLPTGYAELARMVIAGELHDKPRIAAAIETVWQGMEGWLVAHEVDFGARQRWPWVTE